MAAAALGVVGYLMWAVLRRHCPSACHVQIALNAANLLQQVAPGSLAALAVGFVPGWRCLVEQGQGVKQVSVVLLPSQ